MLIKALTGAHQPGSLSFGFESMNGPRRHGHAPADTEAGFRRVHLSEPGHPYSGARWPPGHGPGYEHTFVHEVKALATGADPEPSFACESRWTR